VCWNSQYVATGRNGSQAPQFTIDVLLIVQLFRKNQNKERKRERNRTVLITSDDAVVKNVVRRATQKALGRCNNTQKSKSVKEVYPTIHTGFFIIRFFTHKPDKVGRVGFSTIIGVSHKKY